MWEGVGSWKIDSRTKHIQTHTNTLRHSHSNVNYSVRRASLRIVCRRLLFHLLFAHSHTHAHTVTDALTEARLNLFSFIIIILIIWIQRIIIDFPAILCKNKNLRYTKYSRFESPQSTDRWRHLLLRAGRQLFRGRSKINRTVRRK